MGFFLPSLQGGAGGGFFALPFRPLNRYTSPPIGPPVP